MQKGDIITAFDGISVTDYNELVRTLQYYKAGETVNLTIQRAGENGGYEEKSIRITLGTNENADSGQKENDSERIPDSFFGGMFGY